jgi:hypothetical protein
MLCEWQHYAPAGGLVTLSPTRATHPCHILHARTALLQRKLAGLEDAHAALTASSKDAAAAQQAAQADAAKLRTEVSRLEGTVQRLESR